MQDHRRLCAKRIGWGVACALLLTLTACHPAEPGAASQKAAGLDGQIDWSRARLIAVQQSGRYKTLDSFARESFAAMTGREYLPGLSPLGSLLEWLFNRDAYADTPLIRVREADLRARLTADMPDKDRQRIHQDQLFTLREFSQPRIEDVLSAMEAQPLTRRAAGRAQHGRAVALMLDRMIRIVPIPGADSEATWLLPNEAMANLSDAQLSILGLTRADLPAEARTPIPGLSPDQALKVTIAWTSLRAAWLRGERDLTQKYLDRLADVLPTLAAAGVYPAVSQRRAEARYYALGKFTWGWVLYFFALLVSVWALITRWRTPWILSIILLAAALGCHAYGVSLRWYILGRIPVANMFEAIVASACVAIAAVVVLELFFRTRVFLVAASLAGFLGLLLAGFVLPGGELSSIPAILDHVQLRLHTVLVISAYAFIFLAAVVAVIYLIGYYAVRLGPPMTAPTMVASAGGSSMELSMSRRSIIARAASGAEGRRKLPHLAGFLAAWVRRSTPASPLVAGASGGSAVVGMPQRPIMAGATPGDEGRSALPQWLQNMDWFHLIILNMAFVMLFVGVVLGAIWANDAWGRPWGWDPKEVFALNTWLVYAILIHVRFVVRNRGLWTAWLSIAGCSVMAFNWFFVNFYINSIHSYA
jgi:ABC-type transport system involved in cytochrome c biogenesis permease subunit